jgi:seryl-tRNA synthetase
MIKTDVYEKMARLEPRSERYEIASDDSWLIGSAEHTMGPMHMDQTIDYSHLPIRYVGMSVALRREAGSYGKDTKGIFRLHQFDKIEMESFSDPEQGLNEHMLMVAIQEYLMKSLRIPYQVILKCTGDMGTPNARAVDINAWLPGQNRYRETHTADYMSDYQSRRLGTKVRSSDKISKFVHMNDATVFAIGRTIIAIIENYQTKNSTIRVPDVLVEHMFGINEIK